MADANDPMSRRTAIATAGVVGLGIAGAARAAAASPPPVDTGVVTDGKVRFPPISDPTDGEPQQPPNPDPLGKRVGFAVVGLGKLAVEQILPAFA